MAKGDLLSTLQEAVKNNDGNRIKKILSGSDEDFDDLVHLAVSCNSKDALAVLLESGCSSNSMNDEFKRPIELAILMSRVDLIPILFKHEGCKDFVFKDGDTVLHYAARIGSPESAECFLKLNQGMIVKGNHFGQTPLHLASSTDKFEVVKVLIDYKAYINLRDNDGRTPLYKATGRSLKLLLSAGAHVNIEDNQGKTPLSCAVARGSLEDTKIFVGNRADIIDYEKPLQKAVELGRADIVELLIKAGAKFRTNSCLVKSAIDKGHVETLQTLLANGVDPNIILNSYPTTTALLYAQKYTDQKVIKLLEQYVKK